MAAEKTCAAKNVSKPGRRLLPVLSRRAAGRDFVWLDLSAPADWRSLPGQFVNVLAEADPDLLAATEGRPIDIGDGLVWPKTAGLELAGPRPVARRPLSIARLRQGEDGTILVLLVRTVGPGTRWLASRPVGATVDLVGPLGNPFTPPAEVDRLSVLVGGGCGMAPIFGLADLLSAAGRRTLVVFGASSLEDMPTTFRARPRPTGDRAEATDLIEEFAETGTSTVLATDDGSAGFEGTATRALRRWIETRWDGEPLALYGCGPEPMLRDLARVALERNLPCQVSLERWMGCGAGLCLSCVHKRRSASHAQGWTYGLTCRDGPVVEVRDLVWDEAGKP